MMITDCAYCLQGMRTVGPHVAAQFCEIVKLRNKLARNLGYEDFYDYKVTFTHKPHMHTCSDRMAFNRMRQGRMQSTVTLAHSTQKSHSYTVGRISVYWTSNMCELQHSCEPQLCVQAAVLPDTASQPAHLSVYSFTGCGAATCNRSVTLKQG